MVLVLVPLLFDFGACGEVVVVVTIWRSVV